MEPKYHSNNSSKFILMVSWHEKKETNTNLRWRGMLPISKYTEPETSTHINIFNEVRIPIWVCISLFTIYKGLKNQTRGLHFWSGMCRVIENVQEPCRIKSITNNSIYYNLTLTACVAFQTQHCPSGGWVEPLSRSSLLSSGRPPPRPCPSETVI